MKRMRREKGREGEAVGARAALLIDNDDPTTEDDGETLDEQMQHSSPPPSKAVETRAAWLAALLHLEGSKGAGRGHSTAS